MNETDKFQAEVAGNIAGLQKDTDVQALSRIWLREITRHKYAYNFTSLGRPLIQFPQDMIAIQELIWNIRPDLIIEAGIAHGGSLVMSASQLALLDYCDAVRNGEPLDPRATNRRVLGIDIDIRVHNRAAIEAHPMSHRIDMIQGSSIDPEIIAQVQGIAKKHKRVLVILDSNHTHDHVLAELEAYAPLTSPGSYCIVFDTLLDDMPDDLSTDRPWGKNNNPKTAVREYMRRLKRDGRVTPDGKPLEFEVDGALESKLLITVAPDGYLRRI
jgi:cephalosporin hydroxylase